MVQPFSGLLGVDYDGYLVYYFLTRFPSPLLRLVALVVVSIAATTAVVDETRRDETR